MLNDKQLERYSRQILMSDFDIEGQEKLKEGTSVVIFPQATRMPKFDSSLFNSIGIKLARKAKVKAIPIALKTDFWQNSRVFKAFGKIKKDLPIHLKFGKILEITGNGREQHQKVVDFIIENLNNWNPV